MLRARTDDAFDGAAPGVHALVRQAVHQVGAEVVETGLANGCKRCERLGRPVPPPEHPQLGVIKGLDAEADAVDT